jgi:hypothetical protein
VNVGFHWMLSMARGGAKRARNINACGHHRKPGRSGTLYPQKLWISLWKNFELIT